MEIRFGPREWRTPTGAESGFLPSLSPWSHMAPFQGPSWEGLGAPSGCFGSLGAPRRSRAFRPVEWVELTQLKPFNHCFQHETTHDETKAHFRRTDGNTHVPEALPADTGYTELMPGSRRHSQTLAQTRAQRGSRCTGPSGVI